MAVTSIVKQKDFLHGSSMSVLSSPTNHDGNRPLSQKPTARAKSTQKAHHGMAQYKSFQHGKDISTGLDDKLSQLTAPYPGRTILQPCVERAKEHDGNIFDII